MKKCLLLLIVLFIFNTNSNKADTVPESSRIDVEIVKDLILIKNTYNWVDDEKIKLIMIRKQNKLIYNYEKHLYQEYLIKE